MSCRVGLAGPRGPLAALCVSALSSLCCCRQQAPPQAHSLRDTVERGPLKLTVEAAAPTAAVGDLIDVSVAVEAPAEFDVRLPDETDFGDLPVRRGASPEPQPGSRGLLWRRTFTIEPLVSGTLEIPPLVAKYGRRQEPPETQPALDSELVSHALKIDVRSALTDKDHPTRPRDITGTLLPPRPPWPWWAWCLLAAALLAASTAAYGIYRALRRRALRPPPPVLPEIWALRALAELEHWDWCDRDRVREYYYRLTEVVRRYVELKFGLAAPEMTTEEFLLTLARDGRKLPYETARLRAFLEACDQVKYAALHPARDAGEGVLHAARAFVQATAAAGGGASGGGGPAT